MFVIKYDGKFVQSMAFEGKDKVVPVLTDTEDLALMFMTQEFAEQYVATNKKLFDGHLEIVELVD